MIKIINRNLGDGIIYKEYRNIEGELIQSITFTNGVIFSNGFEMGKSVIANYYIPESLLVLEKDVMFKQNETVFFGQTAEIDLEGGNIVIFFARDCHLEILRKRESDLDFDLSLD